MKRRKIVAGNWKMNMNYKEAMNLFDSIIARGNFPEDVEVLIAPPAVYLSELSMRSNDVQSLKLAAQNCHFMDNGAFTGEISASMLASISVEYCLVGHSERRSIFKESNEEIGRKVEILIRHGITPIICVGEMLDHRYAGKHFEVVESQIRAAIEKLDKTTISKVLVAYEPVWAIGTGQTASPEQAQEMHAFIRDIFSREFGEEAGQDIALLYGGSCNSSNAAELFSQPDINGGLIGGASLKDEDFMSIIQSFP